MGKNKAHATKLVEDARRHVKPGKTRAVKGIYVGPRVADQKLMVVWCQSMQIKAFMLWVEG